MTHPLVLAITGASGGIFAARLLQLLDWSGRSVHLTVSPSGWAVLRQELAVERPSGRFDARQLCWDRLLEHARPPATPLVECARRERSRWALSGGQSGNGTFHYHEHDDFSAPIASGSYLSGGMVVCPCSGSTLAAVAHAAGTNLIHRAAEVHLKERRPLVLVPRETPVSLPQLQNMVHASQAGAVILPASPGWYHAVHSLVELVDFIVARILDQLQIPHQLIRRWGQEESGSV